MRLLYGLVIVVLIGAYYSKYGGLARGLLCIVTYIYTVWLFLNPDSLLEGVLSLVCATFFIRNQFPFSYYTRNLVTGTLLVSDMVIIGLYTKWISVELTLSNERIKTSLACVLPTIVNCVFSELYFDYVKQKTIDSIKKAIEDKEGFLATMSHEIRNPLQSLLGSIELLQQGVDKIQRNSLIGVIKSCCEVVLNIVTNILDLSKIEANKLELSIVPSNLNEIVNKMLRLSAQRAMAKGLAITYLESTPLPPCLRLDAQRIQQVIINLLSNSIKFTQKGQVIVSAAWIPLEEHSDMSAMIKAQLKESNWLLTLYPIHEIEDPSLEQFKMQKLLDPYLFVPSGKGRQSESVSVNPDSDREEMPLRRGSLQQAPLPCCPLPYRRRFQRKPNNFRVDSDLPNISPQGAKKGLVKIEVMDTGIGISKSGKSRLFKRYQQADRSISQFALSTHTIIGITAGLALDCGFRDQQPR
eukprot:TRINITY_DN1117_c0_g2_i1.p1 TRINITY_DN1117_c0_g2~~TRINITY_DN1117_c0_g2_i1.p1  ORF type:complete len:468 (+),score=33.12 TRINITY_DN1117_c0_g2_i1:375-1778(+)